VLSGGRPPRPAKPGRGARAEAGAGKDGLCPSAEKAAERGTRPSEGPGRASRGPPEPPLRPAWWGGYPPRPHITTLPPPLTPPPLLHRRYLGIAKDAEASCADPKHFDALIAEQTPGGINEQSIQNLERLGAFKGYGEACDGILERLEGRGDGNRG
jgi:hypothetical protein